MNCSYFWHNKSFTNVAKPSIRTRVYDRSQSSIAGGQNYGGGNCGGGVV